MGLPDIVIEFTKKAIQTVRVGSQGVVGIILVDESIDGAYEVYNLSGAEMIPEKLNEANTAYLERAFLGAPQKVVACVLSTGERVDMSADVLKIPEGSEKSYEKTVSEMIEDGFILADGSVVATFPYVKGFEKFSTIEEQQSGNYFPFKMVKSGSTMTIWKNGVKVRDAVAWEEDNIFRVTAPTDTFKVEVDGEEVVTFNFKYSTFKTSTAETVKPEEEYVEGVRWDDALKYFGNTRVNYVCMPPDADAELSKKLVDWVIKQRAAGKRLPKAVVAGVKADNKGVINVVFTGGDTIKEGDITYTAAQFCSRIAGAIAGLDLTQSATYYALPEITEIPDAEDEDVDTTIDEGGLTLYDTGSGIVIGRGVTSLTTVDEVNTEDLKKIKIVAIQDLISMDLMDTINSTYIGKYSNSYDNKCLLITAILRYFDELEKRGYLMAGRSTIEINLEKQKKYLESQGVDTSELDEQGIKSANTGSHVFLKGSVGILDAIEDVDIILNKE